jgi:hypothetical protein
MGFIRRRCSFGIGASSYPVLIKLDPTVHCSARPKFVPWTMSDER